MSEHIPTTRQLILRHSKARVVAPSGKRFMYADKRTGATLMSRPMNDADAIYSVVRKYAH